MFKRTLNNIVNFKNILILGFGREGQSTYRTLRKYYPKLKLTIADKMSDFTAPRLASGVNQGDIDQFTTFISGENYLQNLTRFDMIIKTPGIPITILPKDVPHEIVTSQTDIFLKLFPDQIIGITGTKGKSTTSSLIFHIIRNFTNDAIFVGNIGVPPFDMIQKVRKNTKIVFELSCHQLSNISVSPHIAVLLNIFQEHLDYYKTFEDYQLAKFNIAKFQKENDYFIFNSDSDNIVKLIRRFYIGHNYFSYSLNNKTDNGCSIIDNTICYFNNRLTAAGQNVIANPDKIYNLDNKRNLIGEHNLLNIMASIIVCKIINIPDEIIVESINSFKGLKHRLEYVGEIDDVYYYNDSIATIPEATIEAVKALKSVDSLILGGYERGLDYTYMIKFLSTSVVRNFICLGDAGQRILNEMTHLTNKNLYQAKDMAEAVKIAKSVTQKKKICLLSPAAASYGMFKDFEDRGESFRRLVVS